MITDNGTTHIIRYLARQTPNIAESIAFGVGTDAESALDERLSFEIGRADINLIGPDFNESCVVFKAILPRDLDCVINEIGLYSVSVDTAAGEGASRLIAVFDSGGEGWLKGSDDTASTFVSTNSRVGGDSLSQTPGTSTTSFDYLNDLSYDLSSYSGSDLFKIAFYTGNANNHTSQVRFMTDTSNYFTASIAAQSVGYHIISVAKGNLTVTGNPEWSNINRIESRTTASGTGAADMQWESIRIDDVDTLNPSYLLVARKVLASPLIKTSGKTQEVEYALEVNII